MNRFEPIAPVAIVQVQRERKIASWNASISHEDFTDRVVRTIASDPGPLELSAADADWGEQDSLDNIPIAKTPGWVRALQEID